MGRDPFKREVELCVNGELVKEEIQFFGWELLDSVDLIKKEFGL
jgi:S-adenosylmethionine synthetase